MATDRAIRTALLTKLKVTPQALSLRVQKKKAANPMSTEDATYLIAHEEGVKIDKLPAETLHRIRGLVNQIRTVATVSAPSPRSNIKTAGNQPKDIRFPSGFRVKNNMLLAPSKLNEAKEMAVIYPLLYVLENSMREVIRRVMKAKHGEGWWDSQLTTGKLKTVHQKAADRKMNEKKWHQGRGSHPIDYVDLSDLGVIIQSNGSLFLPTIFDNDIEWFRQFMKELEPSRNVVCHMNPLDAHNRADLQIKVERWSKIVNHAGAAIPPS
jgi:Swt1-like HEPN